jgi:hypothetical protein
VTNPAGISAIRISNTAGGIEVDHLQYGIDGAAPPPLPPAPQAIPKVSEVALRCWRSSPRPSASRGSYAAAHSAGRSVATLRAQPRSASHSAPIITGWCAR